MVSFSSTPVAEDVRHAADLYGQAKEINKILKSYEKTIYEYTSVSEKLIFQGQCLIAGGKKKLTSDDRTASVTGKTAAMDTVKTAFSGDLTDRVHQPIGQWYADYKKTGVDLKGFQAKYMEYAKAEKTLEKYRAKLLKKETGGAEKKAIETLKHKIAASEKVTEGAKQEYEAKSPAVTKQIEKLLDDAATLKATVFAAFDVSAEHLKTLGSVGTGSKSVELPQVKAATESAVVAVQHEEEDTKMPTA